MHLENKYNDNYLSSGGEKKNENKTEGCREDV